MRRQGHDWVQAEYYDWVLRELNDSRTAKWGYGGISDPYPYIKGGLKNFCCFLKAVGKRPYGPRFLICASGDQVVLDTQLQAEPSQPAGARCDCNLSSLPKPPVFFRLPPLPMRARPHLQCRTKQRGMSVDHASGGTTPKSNTVLLHVKSGMIVIVTGTNGAWRMVDLIWVEFGAREPTVPTLYQNRTPISIPALSLW